MAAAPAQLAFYLGEGGSHHPTRAHDIDAGWDLYLAEDIVVSPGATTKTNTLVSCVLPPHWWALLKERSSVAKQNVVVTAGVIDNGYRGQIRLLLVNHGTEPVAFASGDRVAQFIPIYQPPVASVEHVGGAPTTTTRAAGGFGSSGR